MHFIPFRFFSFLFLPFLGFSFFSVGSTASRACVWRPGATGPCAKGVATPPRCQRRTTFPSAAFGLRSACRQMVRNKKTTQNGLFGSTSRGWCIEHVLSPISFLHLRENAFLVPCTHTARPFLVFLKDLSLDAPEKKKKKEKIGCLW